MLYRENIKLVVKEEFLDNLFLNIDIVIIIGIRLISLVIRILVKEIYYIVK
jgi:hypothetical protein